MIQNNRHDLVITKLDAYGFDKEAVSLIYSYLKNRKQIFLNDLYLFITNACLHKYADEHTYITLTY